MNSIRSASTGKAQQLLQALADAGEQSAHQKPLQKELRHAAGPVRATQGRRDPQKGDGPEREYESLDPLELDKHIQRRLRKIEKIKQSGGFSPAALIRIFPQCPQRARAR
jgi:hypothetical protein